MPEDLESAVEVLQALVQEVKNTNVAIANNAREISKTSTAFEKYKSVVSGTTRNEQELKTQAQGLRDALHSLARISNKSSAAYKAQKKEVDRLKNSYSESAKLVIQSEKEFKKFEEQLKGGSKSSRMFQMAQKKTGQALLKTAGILTTSLGSVQAIVKAYLGYTKSLYELSRTQNVAGRGMADFNDALRLVGEQTVLSKQSFADFANAVMSLAIGIKPTNTELAKLAGIMEQTLGPGAESAKKGAQALFGVQARFPSLYKDITAAMELASAANKSGSEAEKAAAEERLSNLRSMISLRAMQSGVDQKTTETLLQMMKIQSDEEKKIIEAQKEKERVINKINDLQIEMGEKFKPILMGVLKLTNSLLDSFGVFVGATEKVLSVFNQFVPVTTMLDALGEGVAGTTGAVLALNVALKANPIVAVATTAIALFSSMGASLEKVTDEEKKSAEAAALQNKVLGMAKKTDSQRNSLLGEQRAQYDDLVKKYSQGLKYSANDMEQTKKKKKIDEEIYNIVTGQSKGMAKLAQAVSGANTPAGLLAFEFGSITQDLESQLKIIGQIEGAINKQVSAAAKFGIATREALGMQQELAKEGEKAAGTALRKVLETMAQTASQTFGIDIQVQNEGAILDIAKNLQTQLQNLKIGAAPEQIKTINGLLGTLASTAGEFEEKSARTAEASTQAWTHRRDQMMKYNSDFESALNAQRKLMESAQFGLGASVAMMQKQVDLAYHQIQFAQESNELAKQDLINQKHVDAQLINQIEHAKNFQEVETLINQSGEKREGIVKQLLSYGVQHQKNAKMIAEQQQKIYDLTKDIREGYLDAIREMSTGFGEFTKIIGTQEMGVTQLMGMVKDVSGQAKLNTMALGGLTTQTEAGGARAQVTGRFTTSGWQSVSEENEAQRNKEIWQYESSKAKATAAMQGKGAPSGVGSGVAAGARPERMGQVREAAEITKEATQTGSKEGVIEGMKASADIISSSINQGIRSGSFGGFNNPNHPGQMAAANVRMAHTAQRTAPAPVPSRAKGPMPVNMPGSVEEAIDSSKDMKELEGKIKQMAAGNQLLEKSLMAKATQIMNKKPEGVRRSGGTITVGSRGNVKRKPSVATPTKEASGEARKEEQVSDARRKREAEINKQLDAALENERVALKNVESAKSRSDAAFNVLQKAQAGAGLFESAMIDTDLDKAKIRYEGAAESLSQAKENLAEFQAKRKKLEKEREDVALAEMKDYEARTGRIMAPRITGPNALEEAMKRQGEIAAIMEDESLKLWAQDYDDEIAFQKETQKKLAKAKESGASKAEISKLEAWIKDSEEESTRISKERDALNSELLQEQMRASQVYRRDFGIELASLDASEEERREATKEALAARDETSKKNKKADKEKKKSAALERLNAEKRARAARIDLMANQLAGEVNVEGLAKGIRDQRFKDQRADQKRRASLGLKGGDIGGGRKAVNRPIKARELEDAAYKEITKNLATSGQDWSAMSVEQFEEIEEARRKAVKLAMEQADKKGVVKFSGVKQAKRNRAGKYTSAAEKRGGVASAAEQAKYQEVMASQGKEMYGAATEAVTGGAGNGGGFVQVAVALSSELTGRISRMEGALARIEAAV